jgi:hypothetical protein
MVKPGRLLSWRVVVLIWLMTWSGPNREVDALDADP